MKMRTLASLLLAVVIVCSTLLCGCGSKGEQTGSKTDERIEKFEATAKRVGLTIPTMKPVRPAFASDLSIACKAEGSNVLWQAEYYIVFNNESAKATFDSYKTTYQAEGGEGSYNKNGGVSTFETVYGGKFKFIAQENDTFLYIDVNEQYMEEAKTLINALGY